MLCFNSQRRLELLSRLGWLKIHQNGAQVASRGGDLHVVIAEMVPFDLEGGLELLSRFQQLAKIGQNGAKPFPGPGHFQVVFPEKLPSDLQGCPEFPLRL
mmetsp:Transcript_26591/g.75931  ORF Transcript_26591/g.75931 Transcript_26591/m.75931 type:complete len:100 (-) Transcript_26591:1122-1421(-)